LRRVHPGVELMVFHHNEDHIHLWAETLLNDPIATQYVDGVAFHWYPPPHTTTHTHTAASAPASSIAVVAAAIIVSIAMAAAPSPFVVLVLSWCLVSASLVVEVGHH
jgi:hypothetical protein